MPSPFYYKAIGDGTAGVNSTEEAGGVSGKALRIFELKKVGFGGAELHGYEASGINHAIQPPEKTRFCCLPLERRLCRVN